MIPLRVPQFFELYIDYSIDLLSVYSISTFAACFFLLQTPSDCILNRGAWNGVDDLGVFDHCRSFSMASQQWTRRGSRGRKG